MRPAVITIDGPAGSGKTVVGKRIADALGYLYLDTGAFYRALTWLALLCGINPRDGTALAQLARQTALEIVPPTAADGRPYTVLADGKDITAKITLPDVTNNVSIVAAHPEVRAELLPIQRRVASHGHVVMAGRDIGTVVVPNADLKLYLDAPLPIRVDRRIAQLRERGIEPDPAKIAAEMAERDRLDQARAVAPLRPAPDAVVVDTEALSIADEVAKILDLIAKRDP